jgi:hypothetical protein
LSVGLLSSQQVTARGFALPFGRASVSSDVTEALLDREFVDFGGAFACGAGLIVAPQLALVLCDGLPRGKFRLPAQQLLGALDGFIAR